MLTAGVVLLTPYRRHLWAPSTPTDSNLHQQECLLLGDGQSQAAHAAHPGPATTQDAWR
jgi:hypothetical protein